MKFFILFSTVFVCAYAISEEFKNDLKVKIGNAMQTCMPQVDANDADAAEIMARKLPSRKEGKCLVSCLFKHFGMQGPDGLPHHEGTMQLLEPIHPEDPDLYTKLVQVAVKCGPAVTNAGISDHCDIAIELTVCFLKEGKLAGLDDPFGLER